MTNVRVHIHETPKEQDGLPRASDHMETIFLDRVHTEKEIIQLIAKRYAMMEEFVEVELEDDGEFASVYVPHGSTGLNR